MRYNEKDFRRCCNSKHVLYIQGCRTPLHEACRGGHMDVAAMLIDKYGANPTAETKVRVRSDDA